MKKTELTMLRKLLQEEITRRNRVNELLSNDLIQDFISLNNLDIHTLPIEDKWPILEEQLKKFEIKESNGILVCTGNYIVQCSICYQETSYDTKEVPFDSEYIEYQLFKDIETGKIHKSYTDGYIQRRLDEENKYGIRSHMTPSEFCHSRYNRYLVSELMEKYIILNPCNSYKNNNGYKEVQKDFFTTSVEKGQSKAKKLILNKYPHMK